MTEDDEQFYSTRKKPKPRACGCRCHGDTYVKFCLDCFHRHGLREELRDDMIILRDFGPKPGMIRLDT